MTVQANGTSGGLSVSLRRFNQAYTRDNDEDRVLDYTIALESCLLQGIREELRYRLSVRGAALVSGRADPVETQAKLSQIYEVRSGIVHEGRSPTDLTIGKVCNDMLRLILRCYIDRLAAGESVKSINQDLDRQLVLSLQA
jgi:hypothetical protein